MAVKTFNTGEVLTASDTNTYLANSGLVYVKQQTVGSGVTSVVVAGAFSSTYDNYEIIWTGGTMTSSSADSQLSIQLGPSSVSGYNTAYYNTLIYNLNTTTVSGAAQSNATSFAWFGGGSTNDAYGHCRLFNPYNARHTRYEGDGYLAWNDAAFGRVNGVHKSSSQFTDFTIIVTGTGTMTGGVVRVYGYRVG